LEEVGVREGEDVKSVFQVHVTNTNFCTTKYRTRTFDEAHAKLIQKTYQKTQEKPAYMVLDIGSDDPTEPSESRKRKGSKGKEETQAEIQARKNARAWYVRMKSSGLTDVQILQSFELPRSVLTKKYTLPEDVYLVPIAGNHSLCAARRLIAEREDCTKNKRKLVGVVKDYTDHKRTTYLWLSSWRTTRSFRLFGNYDNNCAKLLTIDRETPVLLLKDFSMAAEAYPTEQALKEHKSE
jgi:hypothetical protein